jgi:hypothetical protein
MKKINCPPRVPYNCVEIEGVKWGDTALAGGVISPVTSVDTGFVAKFLYIFEFLEVTLYLLQFIKIIERFSVQKVRKINILT